MNIFNKKYKIESNILKFEIKDNITKSVSKFYTKNPFPNYDNFENKQSIIEKGNKNIFTKSCKDFIGYNKLVLEAGSGTSQLSNYLAIGTNNQIFALDPTLQSLKLGSDFAIKNNLTNIIFVNADLLNKVFKDSVFDFIYCSGVLHHTKDPSLCFGILANYLKKDGHIVLGLYNKYGRIRTYIRKFIYKYISKKIAIFLDPVLRKIDSKSTNKINAWIQDQYEHHVESTHTYDEVLQLFKKNNIEFVHAIPCSILSPNDHNYFNKISSNNFFNRLCEQILMIFTKHGTEGGLFLFIGKKIFEYNKNKP